jgi:hypothetical protein
MRQVSLLAAGLSVLALAACSKDIGNSVTNPELSISLTKSTPAATVSGPVWVTAVFELQQGSSVIGAGVNGHPHGSGQCRDVNGNVSGTTADNTVWYNPQGKKTGAKFCAGSSTSVPTTVTCTFDPIPATYAFGTNGTPTGSTANENLNFLTDVLTQATDLFVHYNRQHNLSTAQGTVEGADLTGWPYTCDDSAFDGQGFFDLSDFNTPFTGNLFKFLSTTARQLDVDTNTIFVSTDFGTGEMTSISWIYRSRVGG